MKVFIAVDMEGATGIVHHDQLSPEGRGYSVGQRYLTGDVRAVIDGVTSVVPDATFVVGDGHGLMRNVILDELPAHAALVVGPSRPENKPLCQCEGVTTDTDVAILVGFHSMAGTPRGLLAHTFVGALVSDWYLNGKVVGEAEMDAAILGAFDVPVVLITGNSDLEDEVRAWFPTVSFVSTKQVLGPTAAICYPPAFTRPALQTAAAEAIRSFLEAPVAPYRPVPSSPASSTVIDIVMHRREQADKAIKAPDVQRVDEFTIRCTGADPAEAFRKVWRAVAAAMDEPAAWMV